MSLFQLMKKYSVIALIAITVTTMNAANLYLAEWSIAGSPAGKLQAGA